MVLDGNRSDDRRKLLAEALRDVEGWLELEEAWVLHESARKVPAGGTPPLAVEIGSFKGRSTIALAMGLLARAEGGQVVAIDPHDLEVGQYEVFAENIRRAGVDNIVSPLRSLSHDARSEVQSRSVAVLFVDGSHEYEDVIQDVRDWESALTPGAVVAFNDPYWDGVSRALGETVGARRSPFRRGRWVLNTLFLDYRPDQPWTPSDSIRRWRLLSFLRAGRVWLRFHQRVVNDPRVPLWIKKLQLSLASLVIGAILPRVGK